MSAAHRFDNEKRRRPEHHARQAMLTPTYVLEPVRALLGGIDLDPCTEPDNPTGAKNFICLPEDGCTAVWSGLTVFCNPPYGEARNRWVDRCIADGSIGRKIVLLIPAHPDTKVFQKALQACTSVLFTKGRLKFGVLRENGRQEAASHGSALFGFNVDLSPLDHLGMVLRTNAATIPPLLHSAPVKNSGVDGRQRTRLYLAGPMTGIPGLNFTLFNAEAERLRALSYDIVNPAEINGGADELIACAKMAPDELAAHWLACMRKDIVALMTCDGVALLPNWETSRGARIERTLAIGLGLIVVLAAGLVEGVVT